MTTPHSTLIKFLPIDAIYLGFVKYPQPSMKRLSLILTAAMALSTYGQVVYTAPLGYTKITIEPSAGGGEAKLTSIAATLLQDVDFSGEVTIGSFSDNAEPAADTQTLSVSGVTWTASQWTTEQHLAYISVADDEGNADGVAPAEEAFLISANSTAGELTLVTTFDLSSKFPASTTIKIRKANTVSSVLNSLTTGSATFQLADRAFVWDGGEWQSLRYLSGTWRDADSITTIVDDMVIFPDEGIFVQRTGTGDMSLTLFGEVPVAPQIATIEASGFLSSRYPVATTLSQLGLQDSNWQAGDRVYIWNGSTWLANRYLAPNWRNADAITEITNDTQISGNTAVFVSRATALTSENGSVTTPLPEGYTVD